LEESFVLNLRAQSWYNGDLPRHLAGFLDDKSNRLIGWATMRQLRVKPSVCDDRRLFSMCLPDYSRSNEDTSTSYQPGWTNETTSGSYSRSIQRAFQYWTSDELDSYLYLGNHANYRGGGYVYEFRGSSVDLRSNLSMLRHLEWINNRTRAILVDLTLYNPNAQLFTSVTLIVEILATGGFYPSARFEPVQFYGILSHSLFLSLSDVCVDVA
jgi:polycystin 1L2